MVALKRHIAFRSLASAINNPYTYTGQRDDPESLLMYYKNRYYSPDLGRFVSRDPVGYEAGSLGLYEYVMGWPTMLTDELGYGWLCGCFGAPPSPKPASAGCTIFNVRATINTCSPFWGTCGARGGGPAILSQVKIVCGLFICPLASCSTCADWRCTFMPKNPPGPTKWDWVRVPGTVTDNCP